MEQINIAGAVRNVHIVTTLADMPTVIADVAAATGPLAVDVEATGLDIFSASYRVRTVQLADTVSA